MLSLARALTNSSSVRLSIGSTSVHTRTHNLNKLTYYKPRLFRIIFACMPVLHYRTIRCVALRSNGELCLFIFMLKDVGGISSVSCICFHTKNPMEHFFVFLSCGVLSFNFKKLLYDTENAIRRSHFTGAGPCVNCYKKDILLQVSR